MWSTLKAYLKLIWSLLEAYFTLTCIIHDHFKLHLNPLDPLFAIFVLLVLVNLRNRTLGMEEWPNIKRASKIMYILKIFVFAIL